MNDHSTETRAVTEVLARFVAETASDAIPGAVLERAGVALLDWTGVTLAAAGDPDMQPLLEATAPFAGPPQATLLGLGEKTDAVRAALVNGFTSHLLDFDDVDMEWVGHPSVTVLPAVLAAAEWLNASGRDLLESFVIGLQVQNRIGRALMPDHYKRGHHSTATIGPFGAVAGVGRLLRLDRSQMVHALGIAGTQAAGLRMMFGSMCKPLHPGRAAANGLMAAMLAREGFTAQEAVIEAPAGFAAVLSNDFHPERAVHDLTSEWAVDAIEFKDYPSCRSTHGLIDITLAARPSLEKRLEAVEFLDFTINDLAAHIAKVEHPRTALEAKFSQHYCGAVALLDGEVGIGHFVDQRLEDPAVKALMRKVRVRGDSTLSYGAARLRATFLTGDPLDFSAEARDERDLDVLRQRLERKFNQLVGRNGGSGPEAEGLAGAILAVGEAPSVRSWIDETLAQLRLKP